jgi:hypothetical protein
MLVGCVLLALGTAILLTRWRAIAGSGQHWSRILAATDKLRFFGTIVLTLIYFLVMVPVGDFWPNTGMGFLLCSIPYLMLCGLLYLREWSARLVATLGIVAVVAPILVWWVFADVFFLTLP